MPRMNIYIFLSFGLIYLIDLYLIIVITIDRLLLPIARDRPSGGSGSVGFKLLIIIGVGLESRKFEIKRQKLSLSLSLTRNFSPFSALPDHLRSRFSKLSREREKLFQVYLNVSLSLELLLLIRVSFNYDSFPLIAAFEPVQVRSLFPSF